MKNLLFCLWLVFPALCASAEMPADTMAGRKHLPDSVFRVSDTVTFVYSKPKPWSFITNFPRDYSDYAKVVWRKESIVPAAAIVLGTAALIVVDQQVVDGVQDFSSSIGVEGTTQSTKLINWSVKAGKVNLPLPLLVPQDLNSSLYFYGDGFVHVTLAVGFWGYGLAANDYRARTTASQIAEALLTVGVATQVIKHITGRETPFTATQPGGKWQFFPNQKEYSRHVPHYDAYPTGHLATAMATVTIIADNYPEVKLIRPVGYTLMALCGYSMLNNGVHWISDYPLGIAIGYGLAKVVTRRSYHEIARPSGKGSTSQRGKIKPLLLPDLTSGGTGITLLCTF
jgi:hypothetical protein